MPGYRFAFLIMNVEFIVNWLLVGLYLLMIHQTFATSWLVAISAKRSHCFSAADRSCLKVARPRAVTGDLLDHVVFLRSRGFDGLSWLGNTDPWPEFTGLVGASQRCWIAQGLIGWRLVIVFAFKNRCNNIGQLLGRVPIVSHTEQVCQRLIDSRRTDVYAHKPDQRGKESLQSVSSSSSLTESTHLGDVML